MSSMQSSHGYNTDADHFSSDIASGHISHSYSENNLMSMSSSSRSAASSFLTNHSANSKHEDLKLMLESNKDGLKLEAMKRIIAMIAKGRSGDSPRDMFAHVVKNVVTKNAELKKLVYLYLSRYAEQEQDLALLSIATFQRSLKDPNPLIRASAIRVLSSIRVQIIAPIMLIAIRDCSNDMSPYVRKTAAHAIPKLYSLDPDLKNEIIDIIERLLNDKTSLVLGSAVYAFEEVCKDRFDLIHQNYRKFCSLLVDVDEWGQIILINMLIRYARTQFLDPNRRPPPDMTDAEAPILDPDHRLLLRSAKPLLQSRNSGVVLAVIQMFLSLGPNSELNSVIVKPLIRLLHSHREIQLVVLKNIVTLTSMTHTDKEEDKENSQNENKDSNPEQMNNKAKDSDDDEDEEDYLKFDTNSSGPNWSKKCIKSLFEPYLKSFFIKAKDSTQAKILKLEILTNLSNSANISLILREFQAYILNYQEDLEFMAATIQAIGQCAARIKEIAPICLNGLITLLSNRNEAIVSHSIVVIRTQIINKDETIISSIVKQMVRLMDKITTPEARATILWILAEFCPNNEKAAKYSPDVLRKLAKTFCTEADIVKLQALNLSTKLFLTREDNERIKLLVNFIFNLAKYDLNYDVRDRGRFLRQLLNDPPLAKRVLLVPKCVPDISKSAITGNVDQSRQFRVGTLSHYLDKRCSEYEELPDWPEDQPDPSVRARKEVYVEEPTFALVNIKESNTSRVMKKMREKSFYSSDESEEEETEDESEEEETDEEISDETEEDEEESDEEMDEEEEEEEGSEEEEESEEDEEEEEEEENNEKQASTQSDKKSIDAKPDQ